MHIPRLPFFGLLISVCVAPIAAQSSPGNRPASLQPQLDGLFAPPEFRTHVLALPQIVQDKIRATPPQWRSRLLPIPPKPEQNDETCLYIRSYRVTRDHPESDATRPAGYSTCQPAARFQTKYAVDSREIVPR
jgi:hypothetical protein